MVVGGGGGCGGGGGGVGGGVSGGGGGGGGSSSRRKRRRRKLSPVLFMTRRLPEEKGVTTWPCSRWIAVCAIGKANRTSTGWPGSKWWTRAPPRWGLKRMSSVRKKASCAPTTADSKFMG